MRSKGIISNEAFAANELMETICWIFANRKWQIWVAIECLPGLCNICDNLENAWKAAPNFSPLSCFSLEQTLSDYENNRAPRADCRRNIEIWQICTDFSLKTLCSSMGVWSKEGPTGSDHRLLRACLASKNSLWQTLHYFRWNAREHGMQHTQFGFEIVLLQFCWWCVVVVGSENRRSRAEKSSGFQLLK